MHDYPFINPFTDFGFKRLFSQDKSVVIDFLNVVLSREDKIKNLNYLNTEHQGKSKTHRKSILDLYCENEAGEKFIIELQNIFQENFIDRSIFYSTFAIQDQAPKGKNWNYSLQPVYTIGILNFIFSDFEPAYRREIELVDLQTGQKIYPKLKLVYLEIPNFRKKVGELTTKLDFWLYSLKNMSSLEKMPNFANIDPFDSLFELAKVAALTNEEMRKYDQSLKYYWDQYSVTESAKKEGLKEGSRQAKLNIARIMLSNHEPLEKIIEYTGLSLETIQNLIKKK